MNVQQLHDRLGEILALNPKYGELEVTIDVEGAVVPLNPNIGFNIELPKGQQTLTLEPIDDKAYR